MKNKILDFLKNVYNETKVKALAILRYRKLDKLKKGKLPKKKDNKGGFIKYGTK